MFFKSKIKQNINRALEDKNLRAAVLNASIRSIEKRNRAMAELDDFSTLRREARAVRQKSIDQIDDLHRQFKKSFTSRGGQLHYAANAPVACKIVVNILKKAGAKQGVKAKSMVTEEICLSEALSKAGIDAVESDLGEFIIQLAGEKPSHITAPALHKSRQSIGELFARKLNVAYTDNPSELTLIARKVLRERYLNAQFGISGANFVSAESGHVIVVENEGNGRLGATLPKTFIAVTGIEKVIPKLKDITPILSLLPRSSTGQRLTSYVNFMLPGRGSKNLPDEFHLVFVDNGRQNCLKDAKLREILLCIRCGACLNVCPVYRSIGGHAYGSVYPGPMGAILSNVLGSQTSEYNELPFLSTLCGACKEICPVEIDLPGMLLELRHRAPKSTFEKIAAESWKMAASTESRFEIAARFAKITGSMMGGRLPGSEFLSKEPSFREQVKKGNI